tara:strand:+ start:1524 stop:2822 length:1299 start_codon:yes stop_codon:yes gene_type:complete
MTMQTPGTSTPAPVFSQRRDWAADNVVGFMMKQAVDHPECISLAAGLVDPKTLPVEVTRQAAERMLGDDSMARTGLQYGTTEGSHRLRDLLLEYLAGLEETTVGELGIDRDQLMLSTGSQQMLALLCEAVLDPGDICLIADPTYYVMLGTVTGLGARAVAVDADEDGMRIDSLEQTLESLDGDGLLERVKMIYIVSDFDNPRSVSLAVERRQRLVEIAAGFSDRQRMLVVEDAAYRELYFDGSPRPSAWGFDEDGQTVALVQTFSKCFSPGLRVGFGVLPSDLVGPVRDLKGNQDFGSASFNQHLLATVLEDGLFAGHVEGLRGTYAAKRDVLASAATEYLGDIDGVDWLVPGGGLYIWMTVPEHVDAGFGGSLFNRAVEQEQVMYVPGDLCYIGVDGVRPRNRLRLSFGVEDSDRLAEGMARLARAIRAEL